MMARTKHTLIIIMNTHTDARPRARIGDCRLRGVSRTRLSGLPHNRRTVLGSWAWSLRQRRPAGRGKCSLIYKSSGHPQSVHHTTSQGGREGPCDGSWVSCLPALPFRSFCGGAPHQKALWPRPFRPCLGLCLMEKQ